MLLPRPRARPASAANHCGSHSSPSIITPRAAKPPPRLAIGNPDDPGSSFARACRPNSGWHVIGIGAFATPNFTEEEIPEALGPLLVSEEWVSERRARWGEGSALWEAKVRGRFPDAAEGALIPLSWVERARERGAASPPEAGARIVLGVDVARAGSGETVLLALAGRHARVVEAYRGRDTMETAGRVVRAIRELSAAEARVDVVGVGAGVVDRLAEQHQPALGLNAGARSADPSKYVNARAEWYWALREALDPARPGLDLDPADEVLAEQLASIRHRFDSRGRVVIESKDDMRARGLPSPDRADALMLASAVLPEPERTYVIVQEQERVRISPF